MTCDIVSALDAMIVIVSDAFRARSARNFATRVHGQEAISQIPK